MDERQRAPRTPVFGDGSFKGNGILRCRRCGEPYRDHDYIGPCQELGMEPGDRLATSPRTVLTDDERDLKAAEREACDRLPRPWLVK